MTAPTANRPIPPWRVIGALLISHAGFSPLKTSDHPRNILRNSTCPVLTSEYCNTPIKPRHNSRAILFRGPQLLKIILAIIPRMWVMTSLLFRNFNLFVRLLIMEIACCPSLETKSVPNLVRHNCVVYTVHTFLGTKLSQLFLTTPIFTGYLQV